MGKMCWDDNERADQDRAILYARIKENGMALETTDDLKDLPHIVVLRTKAGVQMFEYSGTGCMEAAHEFAQKLAFERDDGQVLVAMCYRRLTGQNAMQFR
jgi:hypothetical protein